MANGTNRSKENGIIKDLGSGNISVAEDYGLFPQKTAPFTAFRKYQKEFNDANTPEAVINLLEKNGVVVSDKFEQYLMTGKYPLSDAKNFIKGTLETMSLRGDGEKFEGFGAYLRKNSSVAAFYNGSSVVGTQAHGVIAVNVGHPAIRTNKAFGIGAHEAYHQTVATLADKANMGVDRFEKRVFKKAYKNWQKTNKSSGNVKKDAAVHISKYGATSNGEALAESMNNLATHRLKASSLSKEIYKQVQRESRSLKSKK